MERNGVQKEVESSKEAVSRKVETGITSHGRSYLGTEGGHDGWSAGGLEPRGLAMRAEPCILRGGLMKSRPSPILKEGEREGSSGQG